MKKDFKPFLTRRQVIGLVALALMVAAVSVLINIVNRHVVSRGVVVVADSLPKTAPQEETLCPCPFDPNTADSMTLIRNGLMPWQIRNMFIYRAKGGRYRVPEDFSRLYGLTDSAFAALRPYISIDTMPFYQERQLRHHLRDSLHRADSLRYDSLFRRDTLYRPVHRKIDTILDLNAADTASLQLIRGIGRYTALRIVHYRNRLGGYVSPRQLLDEESGEPMFVNSRYPADSVLPHLYASPDSVQPIPVNHSSVDLLMQHPYLSFTQAQAIYALRRKHIRLTSLVDLQELECLTAEEIRRLAPYLSFE